MQTQYFQVDHQQPDKAVLAQAAYILANGGLVAFPTETVYGLGANGLDAQAVAGIFQAKGRPSDNPLILHIADDSDVLRLVAKVPANAKALMDRYWPGPLTLVMERKPVVPDRVTGGLDTVAVRLPDSVIARELIRLAQVPVAAPSANLSGRPSPTTAQAVMADMTGRIQAIIDGGPCTIGVESTVVDCTTPVPTLLRPGGITLEMLEETLGEIEIDPALGQADLIPRAPGMKYKHYAPSAPMILIDGAEDRIAAALAEKIRQAVREGKKVGAVVSAETALRLPAQALCAVYGPRGDAGQIAGNLYTALLSFDQTPVDVIYAEGISECGLGLAVMNRLRKAAGYQILQV
ncbi:L-threonylcarbamoyladenylate synthase [Anaerospora hongkongensis]|uniref:L-threonylcarbamoyladenylate synthase n=1 Tax=Anaerospora hongkongensis TaxID=244830 RepID=UPI0028A045EE|nr:L-threonylcarbamoyladenylate synthase [Anaerospora hongkongensis]